MKYHVKYEVSCMVEGDSSFHPDDLLPEIEQALPVALDQVSVDVGSCDGVETPFESMSVDDEFLYGCQNWRVAWASNGLRSVLDLEFGTGSWLLAASLDGSDVDVWGDEDFNDSSNAGIIRKV